MSLQVGVVIILIYFLIKVCVKLTREICKSSVCLVGKTVLITGGNSGIGFETALALAGRGCRLIIADKDDCEESKRKIILETGNPNIVTKHFDLTSLSSVRKLAKDINETEARLDILINNAGTGSVGNSVTEDGLHILMQINHFGPFLLTHLLVGLLKKSAPSRIIFVSSLAAHIFTNLTEKNLNCTERQSSNLISDFFVYGNAKLCTVITSNGLAKKLKGTGVTSNSLHPGIVDTPFLEKHAFGSGNYKLEKLFNYFSMRYIVGMFAKTPEEGAQTTLHLALDKKLEKVTGKFFMNCKQFIIPGPANDLNFSEKIWKASEELVKLTPEEKLLL